MSQNIITKEAYSEEKQHFLTLFTSFEASLNGQKSSPLHTLRKKAAFKLEQTEFPTLRSEDYKYTNLAQILKASYTMPKDGTITDSSMIPEYLLNMDSYRMVFYNGVLQNELSALGDDPDMLHILPTEKAFENEVFSKIINEHFSAIHEEHTDVFVQMSMAFQNSYFIHIAKNSEPLKPIQIIHLYDEMSKGILHSPVFLVYADKGSRIKIMESFIDLHGDSASESLSLPLYYFVTQKNSDLRHYKLQCMGLHQSMVHSAFAHQHRDSVFTSFTFDLGGRIIRNNLRAIHHGENVVSNLYGVTIAKNTQHIDNQTLIDHAIPHCESNEWYKAILDDHARGVFNGQVMVRPDAQKTNAFQQNNTILLSKNARMDSKPQLEIFADDVKCSHGATIGQMDEDAVFYLKSRGLGDKEARKLLQFAFLQEITEMITHEGIKELITQRISDKFDS
jgi:Fe-S cluster assembly protein SufD